MIFCCVVGFTLSKYTVCPVYKFIQHTPQTLSKKKKYFGTPCPNTESHTQWRVKGWVDVNYELDCDMSRDYEGLTSRLNSENRGKGWLITSYPSFSHVMSFHDLCYTNFSVLRILYPVKTILDLGKNVNFQFINIWWWIYI